MLVPQLNEQQLARDHQRFAHAFDHWMRASLAKAERHVHEHVQQESTFRRWKVHSLKDAAHGRHQGTPFGAAITVESYIDGPKYGLYVEKGTRPHEIVARNAPALVFYWEKLGRWVSFRRVWHPGTRPYWFLRTANQSAYELMGGLLRTTVDRTSQTF